MRSLYYRPYAETWFGMSIEGVRGFEHIMQNRFGTDDYGMPHSIPLRLNGLHFLTALREKPDLAEAWYYLGTLSALSEYGNRESTISQALANLDSALKYDPIDHKSWLIRGALLGRQGKYDLELASYDSALKYFPKFPSYWDTRKIMKEITNRDEFYRKAYNQLNDNILHIGFINRDSIPNRKYTERGQSLMALHLYNAAKRNFYTAIIYDNGDYWAWLGLAKIHGIYERPEDELACYDSAINHAPDPYEALTKKADRLDRMGRAEEASALYEQALKINDKYAEAWLGKAKLMARYKSEEEKNPNKDKIKAYKRAIKYKENYLDALLYFANYCDAVKMYDQSLELYNNIVIAYPDHAPAWFNRGQVLRNLGRNEEAEESIRRCREIKPDYMRGRRKF